MTTALEKQKKQTELQGRGKAESPAKPVAGEIGDLGPPLGSVEGIGSLEITDKQADILMAPLEDSEVEIRPDGIVYQPHIFIRRRLCRAFKPGGWGLRPERDPFYDRESGVYLWDGSLWIRGKFVARAIGQCKWQPSNRRMTKGDAIEGAKSDCLTRTCKDLAIGWECWDAQWRERWIAANAQRQGQTWRRNKPTPLSPTHYEEEEAVEAVRRASRTSRVKQALGVPSNDTGADTEATSQASEAATEPLESTPSNGVSPQFKFGGHVVDARGFNRTDVENQIADLEILQKDGEKLTQEQRKNWAFCKRIIAKLDELEAVEQVAVDEALETPDLEEREEE